MGLPSINLEFKSKGTTAVARSARGIVACVLRDKTAPAEALTVYKSVADVDYTKWNEKSFALLNLIFMGTPLRVLVVRIGEETPIADALKTLNGKTWNYLTIPGIEASELTAVSAWIKEQRENHKKTYKAVLPNSAADSEGIVNLTTDKFVVTDGENQTEYTRAEYCARIAGLLAGLPLSRSATYYELAELVSCAVPDDPDERIDKGELVVVYDDEKYKIGRGVNSFVSWTADKGEDWSKIKIVEGIDLYRDDITATFKNYYVGKVINDYDNKQQLVGAIAAYHKELLGDVLDRSYNHTIAISVEAQDTYLKSKGIDTSEMSDQEIAEANTGSKVFLAGNVKFVDCMEDLDLPIEI